MTKAQFIKAFKRGLGSALIQIKNSKNRDEYRETVLWCCLHDTCYDMQCEGNRSVYLYDAIALFEDVTYFEASITKKFSREMISDYWVFSQLNDLLYQFAAHGSDNAKSVLYHKYDFLLSRLSAMRKWQGDYAIAFEAVCMVLISLDGFKSFKRIIADVGSQIVKTTMPHLFIMDEFYYDSKAKFGKTIVDNYLKIQATTSEGIAVFLKEVKRFENHIRDEQPIPTMQGYIENQTVPRKIKNSYYVRRYAKVATDTELMDIANTAMLEESPQLKSKLLHVFTFRTYPLDVQNILE